MGHQKKTLTSPSYEVEVKRKVAYKPNPMYVDRLKTKLKSKGYVVLNYSVNKNNEIFFQVQVGSGKQWMSATSLGVK